MASDAADFPLPAALRPFALLLMRELGTSRVAAYWDHLIVRETLSPAQLSSPV